MHGKLPANRRRLVGGKLPETRSGRQNRPGLTAGTAVVVGVVAVAAGLAAFAVWFQWGQTRRCLEFFGAEVARHLQTAPCVDLWRLESCAGRPQVADRRDVSRAAGLVHLRRGLIEDVNYLWPNAPPQAGGPAGNRLDGGAWDVALAFRAAAADEPEAIIALDLDEPASLTVVGRPGRVQLGPLGPGLRRWVDGTWQEGRNAGFSGEKSGF